MPQPDESELEAAIELLRAAGPEYGPLLDGRPPAGFLKPSQVSALTGWSEHTVRRRAEEGQFRGAIFYEDTGWSIPWSGVVVFQADALRQTRERKKDA